MSRSRKKKQKLEGADAVIGDAEVYNPDKKDNSVPVRGAKTPTEEPAKKEILYCDDISVEIAEDVYHKIMHWIDKAEGEVSGLGKITMENGIFRVTSAILLKQENTAVTTDIDAAAVGKAMFELKDEPGNLNWWWHSHVNMEVFWSGTDMDTIHEFGSGGWVMATVLNKKRETRSCYYQKGTGFIPAILIDEIPTTTVFMATEEVFKEWDDEFKAKVDEKKSSFTWRETPRGSVGSYEPRNSWEGATEYDHVSGMPRLPGNGESRFNHGGAHPSKPEWWKADERDGDDYETEGMSEAGMWYTDEEIEDLVADRLAELVESAEVNDSRPVRKMKRGKQ